MFLPNGVLVKIKWANTCKALRKVLDRETCSINVTAVSYHQNIPGSVLEFGFAELNVILLSITFSGGPFCNSLSPCVFHTSHRSACLLLFASNLHMENMWLLTSSYILVTAHETIYLLLKFFTLDTWTNFRFGRISRIGIHPRNLMRGLNKS